FGVPVVKVTQAFRYELAPTKEQVKLLRLCSAVYRQVYNKFILARRGWWERNRHRDRKEREPLPTAQSMSRLITAELRANDLLPESERDRELSRYRRVPRKLITAALGNADRACSTWFSRGKSG